jgi:transcriptional regulator with XRE-family HTH domain
MTSRATDARWSRKSLLGRRADEIRRAIGGQIRRLRMDAGISQRRLADEAGVPQSHVSEIERGVAEASLTTLVAISTVLGADASIRLFPATGPRIRDHVQAAIVEALLRDVHPTWKRFVEVPVWRPAHGVIDVAFGRPDVVLACEVHSQLRRLEQLIRWGREKADALPSAEAWPMLSGGSRPAISQVLVLRNTRSNRDVARSFEATLRATYVATTSDALCALRDGGAAWPGPSLLWADVTQGVGRVLDGPPRGISVGRSVSSTGRRIGDTVRSWRQGVRRGVPGAG